MKGIEIGPDERIAIVGGGFTGAALALHLVRQGHQASGITVFEPRACLGAGVAYSSDHPDHRFNGPLDLLAIFPEDMTHFVRWYQATDAAEADTDALASTGQLYCQRGVFGRYVAEQLHTRAPGLAHVQRMAVDLMALSKGYLVRDDADQEHRFDRVFLCTAQDAPRLPAAFAALDGLAGVVADPWAPGALDNVPQDGDVLILGTALTAVDIAASLLRRRQRGQILAVSRRGLTPRPQDRLPPAQERLARFLSGSSAFRDRHGKPAGAHAMLRASRRWMERAAQEGRRWQDAFDDIRDGLAPIWAEWPLSEKRRALRHLRALYDVHRYRMAPQMAEMMARAQARGLLRFQRARARPVEWRDRGYIVRLDSAGDIRDHRFAGIINCTGPVADASVSTNPLVAALLKRRMVAPDPTGFGLMVDDRCRLVAPNGRAHRGIGAFGALSRGRFGDLTAVPQINAQILKALTDDPLGRARGDIPEGSIAVS